MAAMATQSIHSACGASRGRWLRFALVFWCSALIAGQGLAQSPATSTETDKPTGQFLLITDLHFDAFYDPSLFAKLNAAGSDEWATILATSQPPGPGLRGNDANYTLVASALADAQKRLPQPDFILCGGDYLGHFWRPEYDRAAPGVRLRDPKQFQAFTRKALEMLAAQFSEHFPGVPIFTTLGNEDSFCGDYDIAPDSLFLRDFSEIFGPLWLADDEVRRSCQRSLSRHGCYSVLLPRMARTRLARFHSVLFSTRYGDDSDPAQRQPGTEALQWLEQTLAAAEQAGEKVWLLMHIPPGIDAFGTAHALARDKPLVPFWMPDDLTQFLKLTGRYAKTIVTVLAGHTHMDDFRLARLDDKQVLFTKMAPGVSPIFGNFPAYQIFQYSKQSSLLVDYQMVSLPLHSKRAPNLAALLAGPAPEWRAEYRFREAYPGAQLTAQGMWNWATTLPANAAQGATYRRYFAAGSDETFPAAESPIYESAVAHPTASEFLRALQAARQTREAP